MPSSWSSRASPQREGTNRAGWLEPSGSRRSIVRIVTRSRAVLGVLVAASLFLVACGVVGCERATPTTKKVDLDPCVLLTQTDATALFGKPAVREEPAIVGCAWSLGFPDHSRSSLRLTLRENGGAIVVVSKSEITYNGKPFVPEPPTVEPMPIGKDGFIETTRGMVHMHWTHGDLGVALTLTSAGPSTFEAATKIEQMNRLARKVDAAL